MILGILSDSHGRHETTGRAVAALVAAGAERLLHLGDIGTERVIDELVGHDAHIVLGNCDLDERGLSRYAELVGVQVDHPLGAMEVGDRLVMYTHGHRTDLIAEAMQRRPDYLLFGHTHVTHDTRTEGVRMVNPGALFRAGRYTAATLDPATDRLRILEIPKDEPGTGHRGSRGASL
jgi:putative phosphoesterase